MESLPLTAKITSCPACGSRARIGARCFNNEEKLAIK